MHDAGRRWVDPRTGALQLLGLTQCGRSRGRGFHVRDRLELPDVVRDMTDGRGADGVIDAVGMEAHGSPIAEAAQKALALLPKKVQGAVMTRAGIDRLEALYLAIESVRRGGTVSISGVYGGAADPMPQRPRPTARSGTSATGW